MWLLINPVATVERFANVVDADLPCVFMASVGPAVGGQGVINDPDPFGAAARGLLTVFSAHAPPDVIWNALFDGNLLSELTVQKSSGAAFSAVSVSCVGSNGIVWLQRNCECSGSPAEGSA